MPWLPGSLRGVGAASKERKDNVRRGIFSWLGLLAGNAWLPRRILTVEQEGMLLRFVDQYRNGS